MTTARFTIALAVMLIGFLPMGYTALLTPDYLPITDYLCAIIGFLLAVHITEVKVGANDNNQS